MSAVEAGFLWVSKLSVEQGDNDSWVSLIHFTEFVSSLESILIHISSRAWLARGIPSVVRDALAQS